jgi:REP element-mobilizing transposase RayT
VSCEVKLEATFEVASNSTNMQLEQGYHYHLYNRSNAGEVVFKLPDNYEYFLRKYRHHLGAHFATVAYCLMPTHFHFLVRVTSDDQRAAQNAAGVWLSSYTKAINKRHLRHGSLFQEHSKTKLIDNERYLLTLLTYIHQNPARRRLVEQIEDWPYSSYRDLAGYRRGTLPERGLISTYFHTDEDFRAFSKQTIREIDQQYWV